MKLFHYLLLALAAFLFASCTSSKEGQLKISATTWIGYTPLFYAKEKGWLDEENIKLYNVVSLSENMYLYKAGKSDAYVGTQYEYSILKKMIASLMPIMLFDRSNGGDMIMSNVSLKELQQSKGEIDTYLEIDSVNYILLQDFISRYGIDQKRIHYINKDQTEIELIKKGPQQHAVLIVTYTPYSVKIAQNGFQQILSTRNELSLLVVDALFTTRETYARHKEQFLHLKEYIDRAIEELKRDPKSFYQTVKPYMEDMNFESFMQSVGEIEWVNGEISDKLKNRMSHALFPTKDLL